MDRAIDAPPALSSPLVPRWAFLVATAGGAGLTPVAPGTAGSALAVAIFVLISLVEPRALGLLALGSFAAAAFAAGVRAAALVSRASGREDDPRIVIDEVVGQLVALAPLLLLPGFRPRAELAAALPVVTGFVTFRVLDMWKPPPVRSAERLGGGWGVMMDDVVAGALAALVLGAGIVASGGAASE